MDQFFLIPRLGLRELICLLLSKRLSYIILNNRVMLTVCVRNDLGREFAQSDSFLTHIFSISNCLQCNLRMLCF